MTALSPKLLINAQSTLKTVFHKKSIKQSLIIVTSLIGLSLQAQAAIIPPNLENEAYVLMDYETGVILAESNADEPLPPASLTKMMTSHIIEKRLLSGELKETDPVLMTEKAWCRGSSSQSCMYVPVNTTATVIDILRGIIIQSGNDASQAIAQHLAGSEEAFAVIMNEEAKSLGMTNTNFVNSTGMPAANHQASAKDLAILARSIIKDGNKYYKIYSEKDFTYNNITQDNRNALLFTDPTIDGLKTGHTSAAGYCTVVSSKRDEMRLIAVIMGSRSMQARADQARELLNWGYGHFETFVGAPANQKIDTLPVIFGDADSVDVATGEALKVLTAKNKKQKISTVVNMEEELTAPLTKGQEVGKMYALVEGKTVASAPIVVTQDVKKSNIFKRGWQHIVLWFKSLF